MASTYLKAKHDIGITNVSTDGSGTDVIGMMLAKKNNVPLYAVHDAKLLVDQIATAVPTPEYTNPEEELILGQSDFRTGFGLEIYNTDSPRRYYSSIGADLRNRDMAVAGPVATAITPPTYAAKITDPGFEIWTDAATLTNWTFTDNGKGALARQAVTVHSGTYSAQFAFTTSGTMTLTQTLTWNNNYRSKEVTVRAHGYGVVGDVHWHVGINDGIGQTDSAAENAAAWTEATVTRVLDAAATQLQIVITFTNAVAAGRNGYIDTLSTDIPYAGALVAFAEFNSLLYMGGGNILWKLNATGDALTFVESFETQEAGDPDAEITDIEPFVDNRLYIALGSGATARAYQYMSTAEAFTVSTAAVNQFQFFKTVHSTTPVLWGNDSAYTIRSNTNPINAGAAWSGQTTVGSSYYSITELVTKSGALYIPKTDMPYYLNSAGAVQNDLAPELQALTASTSGKNTKVYKNNLYIPCGAQGLLESSASANTFISPSLFCTNLSDFVGRVMGLAYDEEWLFAGLDNSTKVEILAGRYETIDSTTEWVWHPINETTLTGIECMYVSTVFQKRLWIASTSNTDALYYIPLPTGYGNITADANRSFKTGSYFITPYLHGQFKSTQKAYIKLTVTLGHAYDADIYITGAYQKLGDSSWTTIGNFDGTAANRMESIYIPLAGADKPISTMMRFKFTFVTDDAQKTPILSNYSVKAVLYPDIKNLIVCTVNASNELIGKNGVSAKFDKALIETTLTNARNNTWPVTIYDIDGNSQTVKFLPLPRNTPRYTVIRDEAGREQERWYNLVMMVVSLS